MSQEVRDLQQEPRRQREAPPWLQRPGDRLAQALSVVGLERWARLAATLLSILLLVVADRFAVRAELVLGLTTYVILTAFLRRGRYVRAADLLVAAGLAAVAGPDVGAFLPFLLVAVAGTATVGGALAGLAAGGTLAAVLVVGSVAFTESTSLQEGTLLPLALALPMTGILAASAGQLVTDPTVKERLAMQQVNRLLHSLNELAGSIPGGLDTSTVSAAIVAELRDIPGLRASAVLLRDGDLARIDASSGLPSGTPVRVRMTDLQRLPHRRRVLRGDRDLPEALATVCGHAPYWRLLPLGGARPADAVLLAGFGTLESARTARTRLRAVAHDGGMALDNARLFDRTQLRAADAARRRIASELHDGVAQSLAHLKLELGLLGRGEQADPEELVRLSRVADNALTDLRDTIAGLRAPAASDLGMLLARHVEDLRSERGPRISLTVEDRVLLDPERADEALRVAQEALSNALRHAGATWIELRLSAQAGVVTLQITDDGVGVDGSRPSAHAGGGVGLNSMRERAERLGGQLRFGVSASGGLEVALSFPAAPTLPTRSAS
ncbi:MAG: hypothetical protein EA387_16870 [Nitriliruptor sp.]|nr:MAG: hypothetical protein EA387_16870 [Nitriliruptor sp.]